MLKCLAVLTCMAATAAAQTRAVRPQEGPAPRPDRSSLTPKSKSAAPEVSFRGGTEVAFDDNILELNNRQISLLEDGNRPDRFRIDDAADVVYSVWAEVRLKGRVLADPAVAGFKVQPHFYQDSTIANYEEYEVYVRQEIGRHEAGVELGLERDVYLRELQINNRWESAYYDEVEAAFYYKHRVHERATLRASLAYVMKDYDSPFGFRDRDGFELGLRPELDLGRGWSAFAGYAYSDMEAEAGALEPDTSYTQHEIELGAAVELWAKRVELALSYRVGVRDYTTSNDPAADPSHVDREDVRQRLILQAGLKLSRHWAVEARYEHRDVNSDRPFDNNATTDEPGDSTRNLFVLGVTFSL